jgi:hypothetical protein
METITMEIVEFSQRQIVTDETRRFRSNGLPNTGDRTLANGVS